MNCIDKLVHQNESFSIHNIKKLKINHLPYSLKVLLENILRNNSNVPSHQNIIDQFIGWNGDIKSQIDIDFSRALKDKRPEKRDLFKGLF